MKPRTEPAAGYRRPEFPPNRLGNENGPEERPPKRPKVGSDLWIVGVIALAFTIVVGALLLAFSHSRELEAPVKPAPSELNQNLPHKL